MKKFFQENFMMFLIFIVFALLLTNPAIYAKSAYSGFFVFATVVAPALFPYMFLTTILTHKKLVFLLSQKLSPITSFLFNTPPITSYLLIVSYLSGYPVGAKITSDLYENEVIDKEEAEKLSILSSTSGISFVVGTMGAVLFSSINIGIKIYIAHILSAVLMGIFFRGKKKHTNTSKKQFQIKKVDNILSTSMLSTITSLLIVGGYIALFYVISDLVINLNLLKPLSDLLTNIFAPSKIQGTTLIKGFFEATNGIIELSSCDAKKTATVLATMTVTFSGLSILLQSLTFLSKANISTFKFILKKILQSLISGVLIYIIY